MLQEIQIAAGDGERYPFKAETFGDWGVHNSHRGHGYLKWDEFSVTHVPTGLLLAYGDSQEDCIALAEALAETGIDAGKIEERYQCGDIDHQAIQTLHNLIMQHGLTVARKNK